MTTAMNQSTSATAPGEISRQLRDAFRSHPAGVAVVTADDGQGPVGLTATSVSSVSMDPPVIAFSLSAFSSSAPRIRAAGQVVIHLLSAEQLDLAQLFATSGVDRFADTDRWDRLPTSEPYLPDADVWLRGRITGTLDVHGSALVAVEIVESWCRNDRDRAPLVYWNRSWHRLSDTSVVEEGVR